MTIQANQGSGISANRRQGPSRTLELKETSLDVGLVHLCGKLCGKLGGEGAVDTHDPRDLVLRVGSWEERLLQDDLGKCASGGPQVWQERRR